MTENKKIISDFKDKIKVIKKHNKHYYSDDSPIITDSQYDDIKKQVLNLENKYIFLKKLNLTQDIIGAPPSTKFKKINQKFNEILLSFTRQALHAKSLSFIHPTKKKLVNFESKLPNDFRKMLDFLDKFAN